MMLVTSVTNKGRSWGQSKKASAIVCKHCEISEASFLQFCANGPLVLLIATKRVQRYRISKKEVITSKSESSKQPACDLSIPTPLRVRKRVQQLNCKHLSVLVTYIF